MHESLLFSILKAREKEKGEIFPVVFKGKSLAEKPKEAGGGGDPLEGGRRKRVGFRFSGKTPGRDRKKKIRALSQREAERG